MLLTVILDFFFQYQGGERGVTLRVIVYSNPSSSTPFSTIKSGSDAGGGDTLLVDCTPTSFCSAFSNGAESPNDLAAPVNILPKAALVEGIFILLDSELAKPANAYTLANAFGASVSDKPILAQASVSFCIIAATLAAAASAPVFEPDIASGNSLCRAPFK